MMFVIKGRLKGFRLKAIRKGGLKQFRLKAEGKNLTARHIRKLIKPYLDTATVETGFKPVSTKNKGGSMKIADIILDNSIYPRSSIDHKRVSMFEENMRDGFEFDPIQVQEHPDEPGKYRILDGAHRFQAYKKG